MNHPLHEAIWHGDVVIVDAVLAREGMDPNPHPGDGFWPLLDVLRADKLDGRKKEVTLRIAQLLVNHGANINAASAEGKTLLFFSIEDDNIEFFQFILDCGGRINVSDAKGLTPLHLAVASENIDFMKILLNNGAKVDVGCLKGETPLHLAVELQSSEKIHLLLKYNPDQKSMRYVNVIDLAVKSFANMSDNVVDALIDYGFTVQKCKVSEPAFLFEATKGGFYRLVEDLLRRGGDANWKLEGQSLLSLSCDMNSPLMGRLFIIAGADVNARDNMGQTVLFHSVKFQKREFFNFIIGLDLDVNLPNILGITPLHLAAKSIPSEHYLIPLLKKGADIDAVSLKNRTPLHFAIEAGLKENVQTLLEYHPSLKLAQYKDVFKVALKRLGFLRYSSLIGMVEPRLMRDSQMSDLLLDLFLMDIKKSFHFKTLPENNARTHSEISSKYEVVLDTSKPMSIIDSRDIYFLLMKNMIPSDMGLLMCGCVIRSMTKILLLLLGSNRTFNLNSNIGGKTLLHYAVEFCPQAIELLWKYGADVNIGDQDGNTPLHLACRLSSVSAVKELLRLGPDLHIQNNRGLMPLDVECNAMFSNNGFKTFLTTYCSSLILLQDIKTFSYFSSNKDFHATLFTYIGEIEAMRKLPIPNTKLSFFNLIKSSEQRVSVYMKNPHIVSVLKLIEFEKLFPIYGNIMKSKIYRGQMRRTLTDKAVKKIVPKMGFISTLPRHIIDQILSLLSIEELGILNRHHLPRQHFSHSNLKEYVELFPPTYNVGKRLRRVVYM